MLAQAINGVAPPKGGDLSSIVQLRSLGGQSFTSFSKNKKWAKDLYADFVAQVYITHRLSLQPLHILIFS